MARRFEIPPSAELDFRIIPAGFDAPLEYPTA
jgi:hypothetical protein